MPHLAWTETGCMKKIGGYPKFIAFGWNHSLGIDAIFWYYLFVV